ncbi:MAG: DinB family protein [Thermoanaerobaculia bacterium]
MKRTCALALLVLFAIPLFAAKNSAPAPKGFRAEFTHDLDDVQKKIIDLANAVPADKYSWRPAPGVRSVSEVYMHIAGGNYFLATFLGVNPPADMPKDIEKNQDKAAVLAELKKSFDHLRNIASNMSDADLEKSVNMFGETTTQRGVYVTILTHLHEHLGQSVAYARINGVVPPWSMKK